MPPLQIRPIQNRPHINQYRPNICVVVSNNSYDYITISIGFDNDNLISNNWDNIYIIDNKNYSACNRKRYCLILSVGVKLFICVLVIINFFFYSKEELEDTIGVIRIRISKKNRQRNGQTKKYKRANKELKNTHKTKDRVTRTPDASEG